MKMTEIKTKKIFRITLSSNLMPNFAPEVAPAKTPNGSVANQSKSGNCPCRMIA